MKKITRIEEFAGKTIHLATESVDGREIVLVFEDNDWAVLQVEDCGCEDSHVDIHHYHNDNVRHYLTPDDLLKADLINHGQYELIKKENATKAAERNRAHAAALLAEADKLEQLA